MANRKTHYFGDCTGTTYSDPEDTLTAPQVGDVTCGQCKQAILRVIQQADWSKLPKRVLEVVEAAAFVACGVSDELT